MAGRAQVSNQAKGLTSQRRHRRTPAQQIMDKNTDPGAAETARTTDSPAVDLPCLVRSCVTVAELKVMIADWPETDAMGDPTEVWLETGVSLTSPCNEVCPLNYRIREDGTPTSDLCFSPSPSAWDSKPNGEASRATQSNTESK